MRLVQIVNSQGERRVGLVEDSTVRLVKGVRSVYELAQQAIHSGTMLAATVEERLSGEALDYDTIYAGAGEWRLLPPVDHPEDAARCLVTGTGLTHMASAANRDAMHAAAMAVTDSMRMYQWGVEGGRPPAGAIGVSPEWFYKGNGSIVRAHGEPLLVPRYAEDGGEEPEIAGVYTIGPKGEPFRLGMAQGNEFSDHCFEKKNYLYLAGSKLRQCAIGPELIVNPDFTAVAGTVAVLRGGDVLWQKEIRSGDQAMCHSLANIEHHHFKIEAHRRPGDLHIHFFGADAFSFGAGIRLQAGDVMEVAFAGFGRSLRNHLVVDARPDETVQVRTL